MFQLIQPSGSFLIIAPINTCVHRNQIVLTLLSVSRAMKRALWLIILCSFAACSRKSSSEPLQTPRMFAIAGLLESVRVVRDRWGVPHLYAQTEDDLFAAQGFVQAQD